MLPGCQGGKKVAFLGRWSGSFIATAVDPKLPVHDPERNTLRGFLQLYLTENRCAVHLEGEQESVDLPKGSWTLNGRQIVVTFTRIDINDAGGFSLRDPNKAFIPPAALRETFSKVIALNIGPDRKSLRSALVQIGPLTGTFEFTKDSPGH